MCSADRRILCSVDPDSSFISDMSKRMEKRSGKKPTNRSASEGKVNALPPLWLEGLVLVALTVVFWMVQAMVQDNRVSLAGDNADYYMLARSIASGQGFRNVLHMAAPPNLHFPPGYPFIMAIGMQCGITSLEGLTRLNAFFLWAGLLGCYFLFKRWTGMRWLSVLTVFLLMFNAHLLQYSTIMMSEISYFFCMVVALLAYGCMMDAVPGRKRMAWMVLMLAALVLMLYIRTAGIAVVLAIGVHLVTRKQWRLAVVVVGVLLLSQLPWQWRTAQLGGSSYTAQLMSVNPYRPEVGRIGPKDVVVRITANLERYVVREIPAALMPWMSIADEAPVDKSTRYPLAVFLLLALGYGTWCTLPAYRWLLLALVVFNGGLLMLWPQVWYGIRFMLPLVPFLLLLVLFGIHRALGLLLERASLRPAWAWLLILPVSAAYWHRCMEVRLLEGGAYTTANITALAKTHLAKVDTRRRVVHALSVRGLEADRGNPYADRFDEYIQASSWIGANTSPDSLVVVCCRKQSLTYLFAGRFVTGFAKTTETDQVIKQLETERVTHVLLDQLGFADVGRYLYPAVQRDPLKFQVVHTVPSKVDPARLTYIMEFRPDLGYSGAWANGLKHGSGTWRNKDGSVFQGVWVNDTINGPGTLVQANGNRVTGNWFMNRLVTDPAPGS